MQDYRAGPVMPEDGKTSNERSLVPDAGRPQFLPPEEPPPVPPPAAPPPPGPDRGLLIAMVTAAALVVVSGIGVLVYQSVPDTPRASDVPLPSLEPPTSPPPIPSGPAFTKLPNPCTAPGKAVPSDVRKVKPRHVADSCHWEILRPDRARNLDVELTLERDDDILGPGTARAVKDFSDDVGYAGDAKQNGGYESGPEQLAGLGDAAFAAHSSNLIISGPSEHNATAYDLAGAKVEARRRNVIITVAWQGADYPSSSRGARRHVGTRFAYAKAKKEALAVLTALLADLR